MARLINNPTADALAFIGGGVLGAGLAFLFAPGSGRKTRRDIAQMGKAIGRKGDKAVRDLARNLSAVAETVGEKTTATLREGKELTKGGKRELVTAIEKGQEMLGSRKRRLARTIG
jgi:gas vesicle protein